MKKLLILMCVALLSMGSQAQEKGDFAIGLHGGVNFTKIAGSSEFVTNFGIGAFGQYSFNSHWRVELEGTYHPMKDHVSDFLLGLTVHYLFDIGENVKLYPLLGYGLSFVHAEEYTESEGGSTFHFSGNNNTDGGIQLGLGLQYNIGDNWFISGEYKFQPGILGDGHVLLAGVGIRL